MKTKERLRQVIEERVIIRNYKRDPQNDFENEKWIFDFRNILLIPEYLTLLTDVLYEEIKERDNFQIGGIESASIPLITSIVLRAHRDGKNVNGFYIRKSRKKSGLYKTIEGELNNNPIILVDDLVNTASSIFKQIDLLESVEKNVAAILTIVRFRDKSSYTGLRSRNIPIKNIYTLEDFKLSLDKDDLYKYADQTPYKQRFVFEPEASSHFLVVSKSTPVVYQDSVLFGGDDGYFRSLNKFSGIEQWKVRMGLPSLGKSILSSPAVSNGKVFFGSYDGKVYAIDAQSGDSQWTYSECEWVGSSPAVFEELGMVYIGLEHGNPLQKGSVVALDITTGSKIWEYRTPAFTHATPIVLKEKKQISIGGNEGVLNLLDATNGELIWRFETEGGAKYLGQGGFSPGDIKMAPAYDKETNQIAFSSMDGHVYVLNADTGDCNYRVHTERNDTDIRIGVHNSPVFSGEHLLFGGLDKIIYCCDKKTGELRWRFPTGGRIFSSPVVRNKTVYVGSNDGSLYEINISDGKLIGRRQFPERVVCPVVFDDTDQGTLMYVTTNDCVLYAVEPK